MKDKGYISEVVREVRHQMIFEPYVADAALHALETAQAFPSPLKEEMFVRLVMKEYEIWATERKYRVAA